VSHGAGLNLTRGAASGQPVILDGRHAALDLTPIRSGAQLGK
jgi:hypothetical protein